MPNAAACIHSTWYRLQNNISQKKKRRVTKRCPKIFRLVNAKDKQGGCTTLDRKKNRETNIRYATLNLGLTYRLNLFRINITCKMRYTRSKPGRTSFSSVYTRLGILSSYKGRIGIRYSVMYNRFHGAKEGSVAIVDFHFVKGIFPRNCL